MPDYCFRNKVLFQTLIVNHISYNNFMIVNESKIYLFRNVNGHLTTEKLLNWLKSGKIGQKTLIVVKTRVKLG